MEIKIESRCYHNDKSSHFYPTPLIESNGVVCFCVLILSNISLLFGKRVRVSFYMDKTIEGGRFCWNEQRSTSMDL